MRHDRPKRSRFEAMQLHRRWQLCLRNETNGDRLGIRTCHDLRVVAQHAHRHLLAHWAQMTCVSDNQGRGVSDNQIWGASDE